MKCYRGKNRCRSWDEISASVVLLADHPAILVGEIVAVHVVKPGDASIPTQQDGAKNGGFERYRLPLP